MRGLDRNDHELFGRLLRAETEQTVEAALAEWGYLSDDEAVWKPLDGNENNFTIVGNQQSDATGALVEKLINGIDAVLMRECFTRGIDPEGLFAPRAMAEAVESFFQIKDGRIGNVESTAILTQLAENIRLMATSERSQTARTANPCYLIVDRGEGQTPDRFPDTFCSLARSNKLRIPFVQGKFNAGGTGVLQFCGEKNYQLIASRRHPNAPVKVGDRSRDLWGFTVIRRRRPSVGRRSSMYVYLAPNGDVLRFAAPSIPVLATTGSQKKAPVPYHEPLDHGTVVKLYEYRWRARSILTTEGRYELQRYLQGPALPFRVTETRAFTANYYSATVSGVWAEIALPAGAEPDAQGTRVEQGFPAYAALNLPGIGHLPYQIAVFAELKGVKRREPIGISFTLNGQVHGALPSNFISSRLKFDYLSDSLLVAVDCTGMNDEVREDFFMASRDRLRKNEVYDTIYNQLAVDLKEHKGLKELNSVRRQQEIERTVENGTQALEVFQYLLKSDPTLATLLGMGDRLVVTTGRSEVAEFAGKKFPTYFRLKREPKSGLLVRPCPLNHTVRVEWETDAANDYFERTDSSGEAVWSHGELVEHVRLWNGEYTARVRPPEGAQVGDRVDITLTVSDVEREKYRGAPNGPFTSRFEMVVEAEEPSAPHPSGKPNPKAPSPNGKMTTPKLDLPKITEVYRENWKTDYTEHTALRIRHGEAEDSYDFVVNMDNTFLLTEMKRSAATDKSLVAFWFKFGLALCALGVLQDQRHRAKELVTAGTAPSDGEARDPGDDLEAIGAFTDGLARVIVPVIRLLYKGPGLSSS